jgi:hypothetical protein
MRENVSHDTMRENVSHDTMRENVSHDTMRERQKAGKQASNVHPSSSRSPLQFLWKSMNL